MKKINKGFTRTPKFGVTPKGGGFTLLELLVVVAIIGLLASITFSYLGGARKRGNDAAVQSNLNTIRSLSEIFFIDNSNLYLPSGGSTFNIATCPTYNALGTNMLSQNKFIADAIAQAIERGNGSSCYNSADSWAIAVGLSFDSNTSWCIDNAGASKKVLFLPAAAINSSTFTCN